MAITLYGSKQNIIQVVSAVGLTSYSQSVTGSNSGGSYVDITDMTLNITPSSASNKVLVQFTAYINNPTDVIFVRLVRNGTPICVPATAGSRVLASGWSYTGSSLNVSPFNNMFLDSPSSTSAVTYKLQMLVNSTSTCYVNRRGDDSDSANYVRTVGNLTAMEIAYA